MKKLIREIGMKKSLLVNGDETKETILTTISCLCMITCITGIILLITHTEESLGGAMILGSLVIAVLMCAIRILAGIVENYERTN